MFISTQITSKLCPSHHSLLIHWNLMLCDSEQYDEMFLLLMHKEVNYPLTLFCRKPVSAKAPSFTSD